MLFVIGWSSIASVSASSNMQAMMSTDDVVLLQDQNHSSDQHHSPLKHEVSHAEKVICPHEDQPVHCQMMSDHANTAHQLCQDCATYHCQNLFSFIDIYAPLHIASIAGGEFSKVLNSSYLIQFSLGYSQDLLRPPQV